MGILVTGRLLVEVLGGKRGLIILGSHTPLKGVAEMRGASLWLTLRSVILALQNFFKSPEEGGGGKTTNILKSWSFVVIKTTSM